MVAEAVPLFHSVIRDSIKHSRTHVKYDRSYPHTVVLTIINIPAGVDEIYEI